MRFRRQTWLTRAQLKKTQLNSWLDTHNYIAEPQIIHCISISTACTSRFTNLTDTWSFLPVSSMMLIDYLALTVLLSFRTKEGFKIPPIKLHCRKTTMQEKRKMCIFAVPGHFYLFQVKQVSAVLSPWGLPRARLHAKGYSVSNTRQISTSDVLPLQKQLKRNQNP